MDTLEPDFEVWEKTTPPELFGGAIWRLPAYRLSRYLALVVRRDIAAIHRHDSYRADQLERALGTDVLPVNVQCCGIDAAESAIGLAYALQAAHDLPNSTPILVRSADLRLGASVANRLLEGGYSNVWLVTR